MVHVDPKIEYDQEEIDNEVEAQNKFEEDGELKREHFMEYDVIGTGDSQSVNPDLDDESGSAEIQIDPIPNDVITAPTSGPREDFLFEGSGDFTDFGSGYLTYVILRLCVTTDVYFRC